MTKGIDWNNDFVVELGCGTGAVTEEIARHLKDHKNYLGFELQPGLQQRLLVRFGSLRIVADDASEIERYLVPQERPIHAVISSLPFTTLDPKISNRILFRYTKALAPGGIFRFFLYTHTVSLPRNKKFIETLGQDLEYIGRQLVAWNLPPAYVLTFRKPETPKQTPQASSGSP